MAILWSAPPNQTEVLSRTIPQIVDLSQGKNHLRVSGQLQDALVQECLNAAHDQVEYNSTTVLSTEMKVRQSYCPTAATRFLLTWQPVIAVESVIYLDESGDPVTIDGANYRLMQSNRGAAYLQVDDLALLTFAMQDDALQISYTAGFPDQGDVPAIALSAVKFRLAQHYGNLDDKQHDVNETRAIDCECLLKRGQYR